MARLLSFVLFVVTWGTSHAEPPARTDRYGDPLPPGAMARLGTLRFRQASGVTVAAYSPNGDVIAAGGKNEIVLWDGATGKALHRLKADDKSMALAFSPDGGTLAAVGDTVSVWEVRTGRQLFRGTDGDFESYKSLAFSPDGKTLATGSGGHNVNGKDRPSFVCLWDVAARKKLRRMAELPQMIEGVAYAPDGKAIASASRDGTVRLWDAATGAELKRPKSGKPAATQVAFSPDGKALAWGNWDGEVALWDVATGNVVHRFPGHKQPVGLLTYEQGGQVLLAGSEYRPLRLWLLETGKELPGPSASLRDAWFGAFRSDGKGLAVWGRSDAVQLWDLGTKRERQPFAGHTGSSRSVAFAPDGKTVATCGYGEICLWELATGREIWRQAPPPEESFWHIAFAPDGKTLASGSTDEFLRLHDAATGRELKRIKTRESQVFEVAFAPDGKTIFAGGFQLLGAWEVTTGRAVREYGRLTKDEDEGGSGLLTVAHVRFSADGKRVAAHAKDRLRVWEVATGKNVTEVLGLDRASSPTFSPDGKTLLGKVWAGDGYSLGRWDLTAAKLRLGQAVDPFECSSFSFDPTGRIVASACKDDRVVLWEFSTGRELLTLREPDGRVYGAVFSPDGRTVITHGGFAPVVWDVANVTAKLTEKGSEREKPKPFWSGGGPK